MGNLMHTTELSSVYAATGPFASVTTHVSHDSENGEHEHELRVRSACETLTGLGAGKEVVDAVSERLGELMKEPSPVARTVVATATDGIVLDEVTHARVDRPTVGWGPLPDLSGRVRHRDSVVEFVLAVVEHEGGDVAAYDSDVPDPHEQSTVGGETLHVHHVPVGGWSALRYQHVTENVRAQNAKAVADRIMHHVREGQRLMLLAGDPQSRPVVLDALADAPATVVEVASGTRAADGGDEALQQAVREALMEHVVARRLEVVDRLRDRLGQDGAAAVSVEEVADAFARGQVDTLLLDLDAAAEVQLDPADHPGLTFGSAFVDGPVRADLGLLAAAVATAPYPRQRCAASRPERCSGGSRAPPAESRSQADDAARQAPVSSTHHTALPCSVGRVPHRLASALTICRPRPCSSSSPGRCLRGW
jgi:hypothetical protein